MIVRTTVANVAILVANFVTGLLAARYLEAEGRGHYALIVLYPQLVCYLSMFGLDRSIAIAVGQKLSRRPEKMIVRLGIATAVLATLGTAGCVLVAIRPEWLRNVALLFCAYIPAFQIYTLFVTAHMGRGDFRSYNRSRSIFYYSYLLMVVGACVTGRASVQSFAFAYAIATALGAVSAWYMFRTRSVDLADDGPSDQGDGAGAAGQEELDLKGMLGLNLPFIAPALLYGFAATIDRLIISVWLDATSLGIFVVYLSYVALIGPVANAVNAVVFHRSLAKGALQDLGMVVRLSSLVYAVMLAVLALLANTLVHLLYGPTFATELSAAYILVASSFFLFTSQVLNEHLKGQRSTMQDVISNGVYLGVVIASAGLLVGRFGLQGMAVAVSLANLGRYLVVAAYFRKRVGFGLRSIMLPRTADLAVGLGICRGILQSALKAGRG